MKKIILFATLGVFLLGVLACGGGGKYADAKAVMKDMADCTESFIAAVEKSDDANGLVAAAEKFSKAWAKLKPKMEEMQKKYPEFKGKEPPAELKAEMERVQAAMGKLMGAMDKFTKFATDPKVAEAMKKMQGIM